MRHAHPSTTGINGRALLMRSKRDANSKVHMALRPEGKQEAVTSRQFSEQRKGLLAAALFVVSVGRDS